ncbi:MAG: HAD-IC family P-type ATPase, partial [Burkholderiales bacterium]|nr:HAD-IC family P-type ATPase [Burkholderiales bacterium]
LGARTLAITAPAVALAQALEAMRRIGFDPQPVMAPRPKGVADDHGHDHPPAPIAAGLRSLLIALVLALAAEAVAFFGGAATVVKGIEMALALGAIGFAGFDTYKKGFIALRRGHLNINALMTVAVTGAFLIGRWPEAATVMALYAIAELIEARSVDRARHAIESLLDLAPQQADVRQADGSWKLTAAADVPLQATVRIRPGERVPLDGIVTTGTSAIDQASVTGESIPVDKTVGDAVFAGTINQAAELQFRVTAAANNTTLARIIQAVEQAQGTRAPTQRFVDRFAAIYTPAVFVVALAVAVGAPWLLGWPWLAALYKALVLLVIACPCALVISTPVTVVSALAQAARRGILIKGGTYLEGARKLRAVALDKTGTVTEGMPRLVEFVAIDARADRSQLAIIAAGLAARSDHPVSRAIAAGLNLDGATVVDFKALAGRGVQASVAGRRYVLG